MLRHILNAYLILQFLYSTWCQVFIQLLLYDAGYPVIEISSF
jgi:hypothetical protein